jgi:hypothetical protein
MSTFPELENLLGQILIGKPKRKADPDYNKFRRVIKKEGTTYTISSDGYIDVAPFKSFEKGLVFPHYHWGESLRRLEGAIDGSWVPDADGYVGE